MDNKELAINLSTINDMLTTCMADHPEWRYGQSLFNALNMTFPEVAGQIRGTDADPFYIDERDDAFWHAVADLFEHNEYP